jgi:PPOX class probable F420-dependent enzyme
MATLPDDVRELLDGPNFVHVASTLPNGAPHVVAIWAGLERGPDGDRIVFFTGPNTRKARNLDRDGRVAFSVVGHDDPYRTAWVRGRVVEKRIDDLETMDHLSHVYTGRPFPNRTNVVYVVEPERWKYLHLPFTHEPGA